MEVEIITQTTNILDSTRNFGLFLKKAHSTIHMVHWYVLNYNVHKILGKLYEDLDDLFDKLQEEIIGTARETGYAFPMIPSSTVFDLDNVFQFRDDTGNIIDTYFFVYKTVKDALTSLEFTGYVSQVKSGINNTVEDILSALNKANYLLSLVKD
jgi:DNA-binding ferritin-like protein